MPPRITEVGYAKSPSILAPENAHLVDELRAIGAARRRPIIGSWAPARMATAWIVLEELYELAAQRGRALGTGFEVVVPFSHRLLRERVNDRGHGLSPFATTAAMPLLEELGEIRYVPGKTSPPPPSPSFVGLVAAFDSKVHHELVLRCLERDAAQGGPWATICRALVERLPVERTRLLAEGSRASVRAERRRRRALVERLIESGAFKPPEMAEGAPAGAPLGLGGDRASQGSLAPMGSGPEGLVGGHWSSRS